MTKKKLRVGVVIPTYKAKSTILGVLSEIPDAVSEIVVVDDSCPEKTGKLVEENSDDRRVSVLFHEENTGVGGATLSGMKHLCDKVDVLVKVDADGQMDLSKMNLLVSDISSGRADYSKATRLKKREDFKQMPFIRLFGNSLLTLFSKASSGYWSLTDPTNGYIAIHSNLFKALPIEKIDKRFFFESDMLCKSYLVGAVVTETPVSAIYADESSNLSVAHSAFVFPLKHFRRLARRIFLAYFIYEWNPGSIFLLAGIATSLFGLMGAANLAFFSESTVPATAGEVMLFALPLIVGYQSLLSFVSYDVANSPSKPMYAVSS